MSTPIYSAPPVRADSSAIGVVPGTAGRPAGAPASILFVSQQIPWPTDSGGNIRTYHLLAALARRFAVTLVCSAGDEATAAAGKAELSRFCRAIHIVPDEKSRTPLFLARTVVGSLVRGLPAVIQHNLNRSMARTVESLLGGERFEVIHLNHVDTAPYAAPAEDRLQVIDTHNILHQYYARRAAVERNPLTKILCRIESRRLERFERRTFRRADLVLACSRTEALAVEALAPEVDSSVVPNGVDCAYFSPAPGDPFDNRPDLVFVGDLGYAPNRDAAAFFIRSVLPAVRRRVEGCRFLLVGGNPGTRLAKLAAGRPEIVATGWVEDVREYVRGAKIFVVPIRYGSGTRLKVLEAFAMGVPTVSTTVGAEGIEYRHGRDILIADSPGSMCEAICSLLENRERYRRLRAACRQTALQTYDWPKIGDEVVRLYDELLRRAGGGRKP